MSKEYEVLEKIVTSKLTVDDRIKKELALLKEAPSFIPEAMLKAYSAICIEKTMEAQAVNECHSEIAYRLGITTMHPGKMSFHYPVAPSALPDIDSDFAYNHTVKEYAIQKYGADHVCNIGTYGKYKFKSLLKDLTRLFKDDDGERLIDLKEVNELAKKLDIKVDADITVDDEDEGDEITFDNEHIKAFERKYPYVFEHFKALYGLPKYAGQHAAGILILPEAFSQQLPVRKNKDEFCTEWTEGQGVSELGSMGAIKIDLLGLNTLRVMDTANQLVVERWGLTEESPSPCDCEEVGRTCETNGKLPFMTRKTITGGTVRIIDLDRLCLHMPDVYKNICEGNNEGVFQFEPRGLTEFAKTYAPTEFYDLALITSLYRPGAMDCHLDADGMPIDPDDEEAYKAAKGAHVRFVERRHGRDKVTFTSPKLQDVLGKSMGIAVFQEDLSRIIMAMTGCSFAAAEKIRKYFTKVKPEKLKTDPETIAYVQSLEDKFVVDSIANGATKSEAVATWNMILPFARYGFNKAHAVSYSIISYQTAFFRTFYAKEFFTALLAHNIGKEQKVLEYLRAAQKAGFEVRKPDVNASDVKFSIDASDTIVAGLEMIKGVGEKAANLLVDFRKSHEPWTNLDEFLKSGVEWRTVNRRVLEAMCKAGCFDSIIPNRHLAYAKIRIDRGAAKKKDYETINVFEDEEDLTRRGARNLDIIVEDWDDDTKLSYEREAFGFPFEDIITKNVDEVQRYFAMFRRVVAAKGKVGTCGVIEDIFVKPDKNGQNMGFVMAKNLEGRKQKWVFFGRTYGQFGKLLHTNEAYFVFGKLDERHNSMIVDGIETVSAFISLFNKVNAGQS